MSRSVRDYRDAGVKAPLAAYLLDKPYTYFPVLGIFLLVITAVLVAGFQDLETMAAEPVDDSPYQNSEPIDFPGKQFAANFVQQHPEDVDADDWSADSEPRRNQPLFSAEECSNLESVPNSMLSLYRGSGAGLSADAFIFGAGQAKRYFEDAESIIENCDAASEYNDGTVNVEHDNQEYELDYYTFENNDDSYAIISAGDAIIQLITSGETVNIDDAVDFYSDYAVSSLNQEQWVCVNIEYSYEDYTRSFYHDFESYEGMHEEEVLEAETRTESVPQPYLTSDGNETAEDSVNTVNNPDIEEPEAPLPEDFEEVPENAPQRPEIPVEFEVRDDFSDTAYYEIPDPLGPGCGWEWSAQSAPVYDEQALEHNMLTVKTETQNSLEEEASSYNNSAFGHTLRVLNQGPVITQWNEHINAVNSVHEDWTWLEEQREELRPLWDQYLADHAEWAEFPNLQDEAREEYETDYQSYEDEYSRYEDDYEDYEEEYQQCLDDSEAVDEWYDQYSEMLQSGEAVVEGEDPMTEEWDEEEEEYVEVELETVPEQPEDCETFPSEPTPPEEPQRPAILDETRGSEPQPPETPEGVTVPESWEDPAGN